MRQRQQQPGSVAPSSGDTLAPGDWCVARTHVSSTPSPLSQATPSQRRGCCSCSALQAEMLSRASRAESALGCLRTALHISEPWQECAAFWLFPGNKPATLPAASKKGPSVPQQKKSSVLSCQKSRLVQREGGGERGLVSLTAIFVSSQTPELQTNKGSVIKDAQHVPQSRFAVKERYERGHFLTGLSRLS